MRGVAKDPTTRARARLFLRSEAARGQNALPLRKRGSAGAQKSEQAAPTAPKGEKPAPRSSVALQQVAPAMRQAGGGDSVDDFMMEGVAAMPALSREDKIRLLAQLEEQQVRSCPKCRLAQTRTQTVFGEGDPDAPIFFIGEGPGETEDQTGRPFVGRAGQLLDQMITAMGLKREQVYIANIVKCRPPGNREPAPDETETCTPYLECQLEIIRPKVIVTLGRPATQHMLQTKMSMGRMRGHWQSWRGVKLMPTFHPAYILRNDTRETKAMVWSDLKMVMAELGLQAPKPRGSS